MLESAAIASGNFTATSTSAHSRQLTNSPHVDGYSTNQTFCHRQANTGEDVVRSPFRRAAVGVAHETSTEFNAVIF
jgi:hypothetical protein